MINDETQFTWKRMPWSSTFWDIFKCSKDSCNHVDVRAFTNAFLANWNLHGSVQRREVEEAKWHQMLMLKDESDLDNDMNTYQSF